MQSVGIIKRTHYTDIFIILTHTFPTYKNQSVNPLTPTVAIWVPVPCWKASCGSSHHV